MQEKRPTKPEWAVRLRQWRQAELWSQNDLARRLEEAAGDQSVRLLPGRESIVREIRYHEAGHHRPGPIYSQLYCRVYGVDEDMLVGEETDVERRQFVKSSLVATGLALVGPPMEAYGTPVGHETVDLLRQRITRLRNLDDFLGGADSPASRMGGI